MHNVSHICILIIYEQHYVVKNNISLQEVNMEFGEKIKAKRAELKISQSALAEAAGMSLRSIQNYESGQRHPANISIVKDIARVLGTSYEYLLDDTSQYVIEAAKKGGKQAALDIDRLLSDIHGLFAGGDLSQNDKDKVMKAINEIYWESKDSAN